MSLLTKASLVTTPTAYGDGVLNSVKPTNGDGDFDFARASSATRVNEEGYIEKERENLVLQSNQFDTTWTTNLVSVTSGQTGYDGSSDAWKLQSNGGNYCRVVQATNINNVVTNSIYAKAGNVNFIGTTATNGASTDTAVFNLSTGSVSSTAGINVIDANIESIGSGWYRCSISSTANSSGYALWYVSDSGGAGSSSGDYVFIQDAQLEQGLVATDYIETTTSSVAVGITNNIPRINYEGGVGNFLLEPQRSNLIQQSEYYGSYWNINDVTIISNDAISPEGIQNATRITESATLARHRLGAGTITLPSSGIYISSVFLKKGTARYGFVHFSGTASYTIVVDLEEGIITDTATNGTIAYQNIEDYGNGWYRCSVGGNSNTTTLSYLAQFGIAGAAVPSSYNNYIPQYTGSTSNYLYAYGAQLEAGYLTTYIPTFGSSVTRATETCNNAGNSDLFNDSEGVLYAEVAALANDGTSRVICSLSNGSSTANRVVLQYTNAVGGNQVVAFAQATSYSSVLTRNITDALAFNKFAVIYDTINDTIELWCNGYSIGSGSFNYDFPASSLSSLQLADANGTGNPLYAKTKMVSTFKEALSDSELECLTSWSSFNRMATAQNYNIQ